MEKIMDNAFTETVKTRVRDFIVENFLFGNESVPFSDDDSFMEKGIIDSTGILELIGFLEDTYELKIEDSELVPENLDSLRNVGAFVGKKLAPA